MSRRAGVLGSPIAHSLSPVLHRAAYADLGLTDWTYEARECDEDGLASVLAEADDDDVGYSCTMPLKRRALQVADAVSDVATAIGAANTLLHVEGQWFADNTDWLGVAGSLAEAGVAVTGRVVVLGAGGTAQAAIAALAGAEDVTVLVRDRSRVTELAATAERLERPVRFAALADAEAELPAADLVISTLPAGAADTLAGASWRAGQSLLDAVYAPWPTALADRVLQAGGVVVGGAEMLLHQAVRQVELMTGLPAPVPAMRAALKEAVAGR